ncbi:natriuretic peptides B [Rhynchocyon petersi]
MTQTLLFLFLYLSSPGGLSYPLGSPDLASDLPKIQKLQDTMELQAEWVTLDPQQDHGLVKAQMAPKTAPTNVPREAPKTALGGVTQTGTLQTLRALQKRSKIPSSGCFGRRMDRISSHSSLGCNGESPP